MNPAISVQGLGKRYRIGEYTGESFRELVMGMIRRPFGRDREGEHVWALTDVSFDVAPGEVLGIIGKNGAGKSTLLKILTGITEPTTGQVTLRGRVASLLEVGTGFHGELTGRENIFLNGSILGMTRAEIRRKFDEIVAFSGVEKFLDTPVKRYSSGMYMRLAFSVAAHLEQEILLVDEVLAVGDAEFQKKCLGKMDEVARAGRTVLFVSHNLGAVRKLCSRAILLQGGRSAFDGPAHEAIQRYIADKEQAPPDGWRDDDAASGNRLRATHPDVHMDAGGTLALAGEFELAQPLREVAVGVAIERADDASAVLGTQSYLMGNRAEAPAPGRTAWSFRIDFGPLLLMPGSYRARIVISDPLYTVAEFTDAVRIDVAASNELGITHLPPSWGNFFARPTWAIGPTPDR